MDRRRFLKAAGVGLGAAPWIRAASDSGDTDLKRCVVITPEKSTAREKRAVSVLIEEAQKRSQLTWPVQTGTAPARITAIYVGTRSSLKTAGSPVSSAIAAAARLGADGFTIHTGVDNGGTWIAVVGADERGLLFGIGKLLRLLHFGKESAFLPTRPLPITTTPHYALRGHQLGYRAKTNAYDGWDVPQWDQYIRDLAIFGTNAIELLPPRTDDAPDSPHFPLPPERMMVEMSRIADSYGLDVWMWYPAMDPNYADESTVANALKEWAHIFELVPRLDAVFVPGGDPGHTEPKAMLAFLEKQKANLRRYHPKAQMWVSPQGFRQEWLDEFFRIVDQERTASWLDGVVFGPQTRMSLPDLRRRLPKHYPIRFYPDITHSVACQYPVPEWDVAYALTEGRECINPRPNGQANILRRYCPHTIGFLTYSEGCNDDVNKYVWSALGWFPNTPVIEVLREFSNYFMGRQHRDAIAHGLLRLEENWRGSLVTKEAVSVTLAQFQDIERQASPALLQNWRFQQALYRAYYDAAVRSRLLDETTRVQRAQDLLREVNQTGWSAMPMGIGQPPGPYPPNGRDPSLLLEEADRILARGLIEPAGAPLRQRVRELAEALFQSIRMQLAVEKYQAEAVDRAANLDTLEAPVSDLPWLRAQIASIKKLNTPAEQLTAIHQLVSRTDPGPGGFYDELGNPQNRPHLVTGPGSWEDPEFRSSALTGFSYPDHLGGLAPVAWKRWAESLFDAPLKMQYADLDPEAAYKIRVVYSGDTRRIRIRLVANDQHEIHPLLDRPSPPKPLEFGLPPEATGSGRLTLTWTREQGLGGNGRGCQVAEVWILKK